MLAAVAIVALSYIVPVAAMWMTRLSPGAWETGSWADIAGLLGGPLLRIGLVLGGMISAFGMFNALVMSYSRLPLAMAQDGMLPRVFGKLHPRSRAPWVAILVCAIGWAMCLGLGFERLVTIDILLYGVSLALEFVALIVLRVREPELPRAFRVPGGMFGAVAVGSDSDAAAGLLRGAQRDRTSAGDEFVRLRNAADRSGRGGLLRELTLKPAGMGRQPEKPEPVA